MTFFNKFRHCFFTFLIYCCLPTASLALEMEPRLWSYLPMDINFGGVAYAYTSADIAFDPVLKLENVEMDLNTWAAKYIRTFELFGKAARVDFTQGYQEAKWQGLLDGAPATLNREGFADTFVRVATNLYGAPALKAKDYRDYQIAHDAETVIGVGMVIRLPTGHYLDDKLLNLGENRFVFRPQIGLSHQQGNWTSEITSEVSFYTENDEFFDGNKLKQKPLYIIHGHINYSFRPGLWVGASVGYDYGGETKLNGENKDDKKQEVGWGLSAAYPLSQVLGIKFTYINTRTRESTGLDTDNYLASLTYMW